ncbi:MAG: aspartate/glutamate racemase family protein [Actinomyces sp.]|nr:MAG: aspartate/glutamate racemase family protein [Actinomyces sp.]
MRTIGLLGGMSWESSIEYERLINTEVRRRLGGTHSASLVIRSYDFATIEALQQAGDWDAAGALLATDARRLVDAGAEILVLCTNTMHRVAATITAAVDVPFLHLADVTARAVLEAGIERVGLLGTRYTMEQPFLRERLAEHGLTVIVPDEPDRTLVHDIIFEELVQGRLLDASRRAYLEVIERLVDRGAGGIIAGCTEIELLVGADDLADIAGTAGSTGIAGTAGSTGIAWFPTTRLHALAAVDAALAPDPPPA